MWVSTNKFIQYVPKWFNGWHVQGLGGMQKIWIACSSRNVSVVFMQCPNAPFWGHLFIKWLQNWLQHLILIPLCCPSHHLDHKGTLEPPKDHYASSQHDPKRGLFKCDDHTIFMKFLVNSSCYPNSPFVIPNVDIHLIWPYYLWSFLWCPFSTFLCPF